MAAGMLCFANVTEPASMQVQDTQLLLSASDIVAFLECEHYTTLALENLAKPLQASHEDEQLALIQAKGHAHERAYLERLVSLHGPCVDVSDVGKSLDSRVQKTLQAMREGVPVIYQAALRHGACVGHADFLIRVGRPSALGAHSYEVVDTKLARSPRAKFVIQLSFYSWLLGLAQGVAPVMMHVVLGSGREVPFRVADYAHYLQRVLKRLELRVAQGQGTSYPDPCEKCSQCEWAALCTERRLQDDHLSQVANISRSQIGKLGASGITTVAQLGVLPADAAIPRLDAATLARLRAQAALQLRARTEGGRYYELIAKRDEGLRGFERMPEPAEGDMYFDMEGNPLEEGGLEYLFGLYVINDGKEEFIAFWAHDRQQEKLAFEQFMDYVVARLRRFPQAHVYHYAPYEVTALKKLMSVHGSREAEVDGLLRQGKLIDLYQVVREGLRVSESSYSIKSIEHFYLEPRAGDVTNAGASIVFYERWKESGDAGLLQDIADYNRDDVVSTWKLRDWLVSIRPADMSWSNRRGQEEIQAAVFQPGEKTEAELRLEPYYAALMADLPADESVWNGEQRLHALGYQLLDFHRREQKPAWWAFFARADMTEAELIEDPDCLGGLSLAADTPPVALARSLQYTYRYPAQESKLRTGSSCVDVQSGASLSNLVVDRDTRRASFTQGAKKPAPAARISLGPGKPIDNKAIAEAVFRFGDTLVASHCTYRAVRAVLCHERPRIRGVAQGSVLVDASRELLPQVLRLVQDMDETTLFLQGPPGAGKTYSGSRILLSLLQAGKRVGVSSNSHHAINNLLTGLESAAAEAGFTFAGVKKSTKEGDESCFNGRHIQDVFDNKHVDPARHQLIAGTAWLFARPEFDQALDYLFVDEAGQVALANLVAIGTSARNIVLLGDQMQLGQPTQGTHPGRSGESSLEYLLDGQATIPPDRGVFLDTTYRMHPDVCDFISQAIYDGRLRAAASTHENSLVLNDAADPVLARTGIRYLPVVHDGNAQSSQEEVQAVAGLYQNLLLQSYRGKGGEPQPMTPQDILIVAPYNLQVNALRERLPQARIGTVDKFQGQEAQVVIVSMATSNGDYLPRDIEFLFSRNRLNVAISRAKSLALLIASPALMSIACTTPEQMALVNTLCWVAELSEHHENRGQTPV